MRTVEQIDAEIIALKTKIREQNEVQSKQLNDLRIERQTIRDEAEKQRRQEKMSSPKLPIPESPKV